MHIFSTFNHMLATNPFLATVVGLLIVAVIAASQAAFTNITNRDNAGPLIPEEVANEIIQYVPENSAVLSLGRRLPNMSRNELRTPVYDALIEAGFVDGDTGLKSTAEALWANVYMYAAELAVLIPIPDNVAADADYDLWGEIKPRIPEAFGRAIDKAILYGTNKPTDWPDDLLTGATAASQTVDLSTQIAAGDDIYDVIMGESGLIALVEADGFAVNGHVGAMPMKGKLRGARDGVGQPIFHRSMTNGQNVQETSRYELDGEPMYFPKNGAMNASTALLFSGDWDQLVYRMRQDITFKIFDSGVIQDADGNIVFNLIQQDMKVMRCVMRIGIALPNPINPMNTNDTTRYPFAVLVP